IVPDSTTLHSLTPVATEFLHDAEYYSGLIVKDYQQLLGRTPGSVEVTGWVGAMQHGLSDTQVLVGFLSSPEYYGRAGNSAQAWVDALYRDALGRSADTGGETSW